MIFDADSDEMTDGADVSDDESNNSEYDPTSVETSDDGGSDTDSDNHDDGDNANKPTESSSGEEEEGNSDTDGGSDDDKAHTLLSKDKRTV